MDTRVDKGKHPDRGRHVAHTSPHAHHGTGVVVGLEGGAKLALGKNNESVEDLVELAQVENPAVESKTLVPETARLEAAGLTIGGELSIGRVGLPRLSIIVEEDRVAETSRTVQTAGRVDETGETLRSQRADHAAAQSTEHANEGPCRVDGKEDVVKDDEKLEEASLADGPGLLAGRLIVGIEGLGAHGVESGDGDRDFGVKPCLVDMVGDLERRRIGDRIRRRWGDKARVAADREREERSLREGEGDGHLDEM